MWCGCQTRQRRPALRTCAVPAPLATHVQAKKPCRAARRLLVAGAPGTGKTYLVEEVVGRSRFRRVFWLRLGNDMDAFVRLISAALADYDVVTHEDDAVVDLLQCCDDPDAALVVDDFLPSAPHSGVVLDLLDEMSCAVLVVGDLVHTEPVADRFDAVLVCHATSDGAVPLPYDELQLVRGLSLETVGDLWAAIWAKLGTDQRRLAQALAVLDDIVPESLLVSLEEACETTTSSLQLHQAGALHFTTYRHLSEGCAVLAGCVRRRLRCAAVLDALMAGAHAIRLCWSRKTSSKRWALSLINHGEALAEQFTASLLDRHSAHDAIGAFCDHLTVLGSLYIYAMRPRRALCSFQTALSLVSSLPNKQTSHHLCMMRTLHCMANVYGSMGDTEGQNRALAAAFAIDGQLLRPDAGTRRSLRKGSRHRLRQKLRAIVPGSGSLIYLGNGNRRHSLSLSSHDDHQRKLPRKSPSPSPGA